MKPHELKMAIQRNGVAPLYVIIGEEDYLRDQALEMIRAAGGSLGSSSSLSFQNGGESEGGNTFCCDVLFGDETDAAEILSHAQEVPMFSSHRVVVVKWAEKLSAREGEALIPYFLTPSESTTLVIAASKLDGRLKWVQTVKNRAVLIDCGALYEGHRPGWIRNEAASLGIRLSPDAVLVLKDLGGQGLYGIRQELDKLASYVPSQRMVGPQDVEAVCGGEASASVFDLAGAIGQKNYGLALSILAKNLEAGEAPLRILGALIWQYRRLWKAKDGLAQGRNRGELAKGLGMPPYRQQEFFVLVDRFSPSHFPEAFRLFGETDWALKGGAAGKPARVLDSLVFALCKSSAQ